MSTTSFGHHELAGITKTTNLYDVHNINITDGDGRSDADYDDYYDDDDAVGCRDDTANTKKRDEAAAGEIFSTQRGLSTMCWNRIVQFAILAVAIALLISGAMLLARHRSAAKMELSGVAEMSSPNHPNNNPQHIRKHHVDHNKQHHRNHNNIKNISKNQNHDDKNNNHNKNNNNNKNNNQNKNNKKHNKKNKNAHQDAGATQGGDD